MNVTHKYAGILTAVPTPLTSDLQVDTRPLSAHVRRMVEAGSRGIVPLGGTGEYTSLSFDQRLSVVEASLEAASGATAVIPGILSPGIGDAIDNAKAFVRAGAKALMVVTPYYFRPTQDGIVEYFERFSNEVDADIILYEIPYRTGVSLNFQTVDRLAGLTRVVGIKACNPDLAQQMRVAELAASKIAILTGEEDVMPLHVAMGAVGAVITSSNLLPRQWDRVLELGLAGKLQESIALHATLRPLIDAVFAEPNPAPMKAAMDFLGWGMGCDVLPPMKQASAKIKERIAQVLPPLRDRE
ncbi:4-hydroxy-tetrahydrodipicolinate synthase [Verminephrobacter eiseniae]|uniref:4-hydroxy-tetrahydrodipicolinate synthase n=1 Tax=Verminephrobacter eiseniae (strain EF01-2) TaxID=391735 RepID=A1WRX6_VEREI|nr:4-hydroxy-tetrahydrodipicolinate synthase [Verminephrobacter eiseniae]ABM60383.1 dihydrodipicolinate synthetase [Verminephrobacter eiseniae EF01-2]MCW5260596.1 4-hydroxy-tetrahydrodipicolinate synthase [Verminephrobacter eiseniae]MCW5285860.1 4-hydroxy-tetrahydrodipicolinate synthase [Verminephrobacter eiseniae]MCW5304158.1 4-hydroxy-tetrahydrodipicolinate synthase [Verminephrobacter eiseniae]MCW8180627.1 4-hydroxy-tetrahydrodipicolinate synthase [Verminephrobacter eiseniae]